MHWRTRLEATVVHALGSLPAGAKRVLAGASIEIDGLELDLDARLVVRLEARDPRPPLEQRTPEQARADLRRSTKLVAGRRIELHEVRDLTVAGAAGPLGARLYVPAEAARAGTPSPLLVFFHGGGWVVGDVDTHDSPCRALARASGMRVLSVGYRLAPEHPYPAPVDDAVAAFRDAVARADELGADPARVAVGGDSAGGHLSAMVALRTAHDGGPAPALQVLFYPATDFVEDHPSERLFAAGFLLTKANMDWYEGNFLPAGTDLHEASPLRAERLGGVAPALVVTAGFDPLRDEGEAYARRLREAGVQTILRRHPGQVHGFLSMTGFGHAPLEAISEIAGVMRSVLA